MNLDFFAKHGRLLCFGFIMSLISSFGQTYFISIFGPEIQIEFGLSHTAWGTVYLIGTLGSALLLTYTGSLIDRYQLKYYTIIVIIFMAFACIFISYVPNVIFLVFRTWQEPKFHRSNILWACYLQKRIVEHIWYFDIQCLYL